MEEVSDGDIQRVADVVDIAAALHVHRDDVLWPEGWKVTKQAIPSQRSPEFYNDLMEGLDRFIAKVHGKPGWRMALSYQGIDFLEVARYDWFAAIYEFIHPVWVLDQVLKESAPEVFVWVTAFNHKPKGSLWRLTKVFAERGIRVVQLPTEPGESAQAETGSILQFYKEALRGVRHSVQAGLQAFSSQFGRHRPAVPASPHVMFVENHPNSAKISASVARVIDDRRDWDCHFVATRANVMSNIPELKHAYLIDDMIPPAIWLKIALKQVLMFFHLQVICAQLIRRNSDPLWNDLILIIRPWFLRYTVKSWNRAATHSCMLDYIVRKFTPKVVASTSGWGSFARAAVISAKRQEASSVYIQHGSFQFPHMFRLPQDKYLVWGERDKHSWVEAGIASHDIHVTGSPKFEDVRASNKKSPAGESDEFMLAYFPAIAGGNRVSVSASKRMLDIVLSSVNSIQNTKLVVKTKNEDRADIYQAVENLEFAELVNTYDASETLLEADAIIVSTSTVGLEACLLDKPIIVLSTDGIVVDDVYQDYGAALFANSSSELKAGIEKLRDDGELLKQLELGRKKLVKDLFADAAPGATERIADIISNEE